jgi:shikimate kinase
MKRHVALVGFMASGKSTIGRRLSRRLGCAFFDTDALVVRAHGEVAAIFSDEGEAAFRRYEHDAISGVLRNDEASVVALGGGALTTAANRRLLERCAYRVFIRISPEKVLARVRKSKQIRPVLGETPTLATIRALYERRMPHYVSADHVVDADRLSGKEVLDDIVAWLQRREAWADR